MGINSGNNDREFKIKEHENQNRQTGISNKGKASIIIGSGKAYAVASKPAIHSFGLLHQAVHGIFIGNFINQNGIPEEKILLSRRGLKKKSWPGYWDITVGEHIMEGDMLPLEVLRNTVKEELGIPLGRKIASFTVRDKLVYKKEDEVKTDDEFRHVFVMHTERLNDDSEIVPKNKADILEYKWFTKSEFDELLKGSYVNNKIVKYKYFKDSERYSSFSDLFRAKAIEIGDEYEKYLLGRKESK